MNNLFKTVFNNKVIRKLIFNNVELLNRVEGKVVKKYNQCKIKWIIQNNHFNLLVYKLKTDNKKRIEFTNDLFYKHFLQRNKDLQLLKDILVIYTKEYSPLTSMHSSKLIENSSCCLGNEEILNYLINDLKIEPTLKSIQILCSNDYCKIVKSSILVNGNSNYSIEKDSDISLLYCILREKDLEFYKIVLSLKPSLCNDLKSNWRGIQLLVDVGDVSFFKASFDKMIINDRNDRNDIKNIEKTVQPYQLSSYACGKGNLEIIKYLGNNGFPKSLKEIYFQSFLEIIVNRESSNGDRDTLDILKYFIEDLSINITMINKMNLFGQCCRSGKLELLIYLNEKFKTKLHIDYKMMDYALLGKHLHIFHWLHKNVPSGCSGTGFDVVIGQLTNGDITKEDKIKWNQVLHLILDNRYKYLSLSEGLQSLSNSSILESIATFTDFYQDINNFNYVVSFLPQYLRPSFS